MLSDKEKYLVSELSSCMDLIEQKKSDQVQKKIASIVEQYPEIVDERFQMEVFLILKNMESKEALREFDFLRSISLVYRYLENEYTEVGRSCRSSYEQGEALPHADTIWWCWLQGYDNAPEIVKRCYQSLSKLDRKVIVLQEGNINEYIELPEYILDKYRRGGISKAHYSDLVRLELLTKLGGIWIDSTTLITGTDRIKPLLEQEDLFMFRAGNVSEFIIFDNWFMMSKKKSMLLEATKEMLFAYWQKEDRAKHYFFMHLFMTMACKLFPEEYGNIPMFSNEPCHVLQHELFNKYTDKRWDQIKGMSDVHKLTYKADDSDPQGTFWKYIMDSDI